MALLLNLETATKTCSVALSENGTVVAVREETSAQYSHSEKLNQFILDVMESSGRALSDLEGIAVSSGPGSYTGLRIGTSTAKGLCYSLDIPLIAVPTLDALHAGFRALNPDAEGVSIAMLDARRMEVYASVRTTANAILRGVEADVLEPNTYDAYKKWGKVWYFGDGAAKCEAVLPVDQFVFVPEVTPSAAAMAPLAEEAWQEGRHEDVAYFEPFYLKEFVAVKPKNPVDKLLG